jgi:hypothetical protein
MKILKLKTYTLSEKQPDEEMDILFCLGGIIHIGWVSNSEMLYSALIGENIWFGDIEWWGYLGREDWSIENEK